MRKLSAPTDSVQDVFLTCIESYQNTELKDRLKSITPVLVEAASRFEDCVLTSRTHTIPVADSVDGKVNKDEMVNIYNSKFVGGPGRPYYDKYMSLSANGKCPFCGIGIVSTLDHYLPKSKYPALALTPKNMIPACRDCNLGAKKAFSPQDSAQEPLHPYFDDVEQDIWLSVKFDVKGKDLIPFYFVHRPTTWDELLFSRVVNHMKLYNLYTLYAIHAAEEIAGQSSMWCNFLGKYGEDFVAEFFRDQATSRGQSLLNSWQTALYRGLEEHVDFVTQWLLRLDA